MDTLRHKLLTRPVKANPLFEGHEAIVIINQNMGYL